MQSYVINEVQVLAIFVPARFFFLTLPIISNSNEEANTFLLVVIHFLQIFALLSTPLRLSYLKLPFHGH